MDGIAFTTAGLICGSTSNVANSTFAILRDILLPKIVFAR
jgi:hypothetical protein